MSAYYFVSFEQKNWFVCPTFITAQARIPMRRNRLEIRYHCSWLPNLLAVLRIRIRIRRIRMFFGIRDPDPNPLVRGMDPDPDPNIIKKK